MGHRELDVAAFRAWLSRARDEISRSRQRLNAENLYPVADADTGSNMEATIRAAADALEQERSDELHVVADAAAEGALHGAQGNSGVLLSQILSGFADGLRENLPRAFALAHERALKAVADPKEGTILSVARAAKDAVANVATWGSGVKRDGEVALAAWKAARASTIDSADHPPSEAARGTIDAGAHGIELIYRSLVAVLDSDSQMLGDLPEQVTSSRTHLNENTLAKSDGAFEVMYEMSNVSAEQIEVLRSNLAGIGQSLLIVGDTRFWKVHVHTDFAEDAVRFAKEVGAPENVRITALENVHCKASRKLITVANGPGFAELMQESGITVITAFNSRRVAPEEWVVAAHDSDESILIPHDLHGYESALVAAQTLTKSGKRASVIKAHSPLQALAAISTHSEDLESDFSVEVETMSAAAASTASITIARALREMNFESGTVKAGAVIALSERKIIATGADEADAALAAIAKSITPESQLITLVWGAGSVEQLASELSERINQNFPSIEVTSYSGGQAWYPLLIGIE